METGSIPVEDPTYWALEGWSEVIALYESMPEILKHQVLVHDKHNSLSDPFPAEGDLPSKLQRKE